MMARLVALAALVLWGCAPRGPLAVRGARWSDPGPAVLRALERDPRVGRVVAANGEPETVEVVRVRGRGARVVLRYRRGRDGRARHIVVEPPVGGRGVALGGKASGGEIQASSQRHGREAVARGEGPEPVSAATTPTAWQSLECPIDSGRAECRALCSGEAGYEWCR